MSNDTPPRSADPPRSVAERLERIEDELRGLRELVGSDLRASELFKKLLVGIDNIATYDHDTVILMNDEERGAVRALINRERRSEVQASLRADRARWFETAWGRAGIIFAGATLALGAFNQVAVFFHLPH